MNPSRSTFRDPTRGAAWQKQLRDQYLDRGVPAVPHLDLKRAVVQPISRKLAAQIIYQYEWLGTMAPTSWHYGIFFGPYCAGVTCAGSFAGANVFAAAEFGLAREQLAYLARGANVHWSPPGANSKLVSWTCRMLARDTPAKLVIAYADSDAGEIGTIYQACNWVCIGRGTSTRQWVAPNGRVFDQMYPRDQARRAGGTRAYWTRRLEAAGWRQQLSNPKIRYVWVLDRSDHLLRDRIEAMRRPYPKRTCASSIAADAPAVQVGEGGSTPTDALHAFDGVTGVTP